MIDVLPADIAFEVFLATVQPADFSDWEFRLFRHIRLTTPNGTQA